MRSMTQGLAVGAAVLALAACGGGQQPPAEPQGQAATSQASAPTTSSASTSEMTEAESDSSAIKPFASMVKTGAGNDIMIGKPSKFTPSSSSTAGGGPATAFKVTFKNNSNEPVDLGVFSASATHDEEPAMEVFDSAKKIDGPPATAVRPGKTVTWSMVFEGAPTGSWDVDVKGSSGTLMFSSEAG